MSNEVLLAALEELRESYSQRQKVAGNAQAALKGMTGALAKAERALRPYSEHTSGIRADLIGQAREVINDARLKDAAVDPLMPDLRRELKTTSTLAATLKDVIVALRAESIDIVKLGKAIQILQAQKLPDSALLGILPQLEEQLEIGERALGETFGVALRDTLAAQGIHIGGRPPRFEIGRFEVTTNFAQRSASILYGKEVIVKRVPLSVEAIIKAYQSALKSIAGRSVDATEWVKQVYTAWEGVRARRGSNDNRANIVECYMDVLMQRQPKAFRVAPMKSSFVDYSRAQFAYDFDFFFQKEVSYNGLRMFSAGATKSHTDNPERSMFILTGDTPYAGSYIGDVKFDRDK